QGRHACSHCMIRHAGNHGPPAIAPGRRHLGGQFCIEECASCPEWYADFISRAANGPLRSTVADVDEQQVDAHAASVPRKLISPAVKRCSPAAVMASKAPSSAMP